jgi:hypothetical protein
MQEEEKKGDQEFDNEKAYYDKLKPIADIGKLV